MHVVCRTRNEAWLWTLRQIPALCREPRDSRFLTLIVVTWLLLLRAASARNGVLAVRLWVLTSAQLVRHSAAG